MARLFVLWQDLLYEEAGIQDDEGFEGLDQFGHGAATRRFYFFRGNSRTLYSAKKLFEELGRDETFARWLKKDPALKKRYTEAVRIVRRNSKHFTAIRHSVGAHVEQDIGEAIQYFDPTDETKLEIHRQHFLNPYPATDILFAALINEVVPCRWPKLDPGG